MTPFPRPTKIISKKKLIAAWLLSKDNTPRAGTYGVDSEKAQTFAIKLDERCDQICREVYLRKLTFSKLRHRSIPKPNSDKERIICIPTVRDRLIQRTILQYLRNKIPMFQVSKYSSKGEKGTGAAIADCKKLREAYPWAIRTDISSFFDKVPRDKLKSKCRKLLGKKHSLIPVLDKIIDTEIHKHNNDFTKRYGIKKNLGIRQGMPLSPMLANIILYDLDKYITDKNVPALRYVDDIVIFGTTKLEVQKHFDEIARKLKTLDLSVPVIEEGTKSVICETAKPLLFLGVEIYFSQKHLKWLHKVPEKQLEKIKVKIDQLSDIKKLLRKNIRFVDFASKVAGMEKGYLNAYKGANNIDHLKQTIRESQKRAITSIFTEMFGPEVVSALTAEHLDFLSIDRNKIEPYF